MEEALMLVAEKRIVLPAEDRRRMSRLYEEVRTRLEEMAMITTRTLKVGGDYRSEVQFRSPFVEGEAEFEAVAIVRTSRGYACYDYLREACFEFKASDPEGLINPEGIDI
jgi:hypothetical protein